MRIHLGFLLGTLVSVFFSKHAIAQDLNLPQPTTVEQAQRQKDYLFDTKRQEILRGHNAAVDQLMTQRRGLQQTMTECSNTKSDADIAAQQEAAQAKTAATQSLVQGAASTVPQLLQQGMGNATGGKEEAQIEINNAVASQKTAVDAYADNCSTPENPIDRNRFYLKKTGTNAGPRRAATELDRSILTAAISGHGATAAPATGPNCPALANLVRDRTNAGVEAIKEGEQMKSQSNNFMVSAGAAALQMGMAAYGANSATKAANEGLAATLESNNRRYDACKSGVLAEVAEIDQQLGTLDRLLAEDQANLQRQYGLADLPANVQTDVNLDPDTGVGLGTAGNQGLAASDFKKSLSGLPAKKGSDPAAGGVGGGAPGGGGAQDGKVGWGFQDPNAVSDPNTQFGLMKQPEGSIQVAGAGEAGGGSPGAEAAALGFQDPFANLAGQGLASESAGNGAAELAIRTSRRLNTHLPELLGNSRNIGPQLGKRTNKDATIPERKITSIRN